MKCLSYLRSFVYLIYIMNIKRNIVINNYNLNLIDYDSYFLSEISNETITNYAWYVNPHIINNLIIYFNIKNIEEVLDVGGASSTLFYAKYIIDIDTGDEYNVNTNNSNRTIYPKKMNIDIDYNNFPFENKTIGFTYSRHTLEDIQNPMFAFNEIVRVSKAGYIETPSPLAELCENIDSSPNDIQYRGYRHHRYIVWSDTDNNTIYFLPKYPLVEKIHIKNINKLYYLLNNYSVYWNNYYIFDEKHKPNIIVYRHGVNMNIDKDYCNILVSSIEKSIRYTNYFITLISNA